MREVAITVQGVVDQVLVSEISPALRGQRTLGDVLEWGRSLTPVRRVTEIVTQDEYTHDVIFGLADRVYLVYDTT